MINLSQTQEEQDAIDDMRIQMLASSQITKQIVNKISQRIQSSKPLESDFTRVIEDNFWDLLR